MIHAEGLTREFRVGKETVQAVRGLDLDVEEGELVAFLGPERRREVDQPAHAHDAAPADLRQRDRGRARRRRRSGARSGSGSATWGRATARRTTSASATSSSPRAGRTGLGPRDAARAGRRADRLARAGVAREADGEHAVRRPAAAARHRDRHGPRAAAPVPRRAVDRARPAEPGEPLGSPRAAARGARHDDLPDHPLPRRGRRDGRARRRHRPRPGHRRRDAGGRSRAGWPATASRSASSDPVAAARAAAIAWRVVGTARDRRSMARSSACGRSAARRRCRRSCGRSMPPVSPADERRGQATDARRRLPRAHRPEPARRGRPHRGRVRPSRPRPLSQSLEVAS